MHQRAAEFLWTEKYRPHTIEDTILPDATKKAFLAFMKNGDLPNIILAGPPGIGKTTLAKAFCDQIDCDYIVVNGSMRGNIDTLRNEIQAFASTVSFKGKRKYVILDEADHINPTSTQPALRGFMEEFAANCGFILTCNWVEGKIIEPLISRCTIIRFELPKEERARIGREFYNRICEILDAEKVVYDVSVVRALIVENFPDFRRVINELQKFGAGKTIDTSALVKDVDADIPKVMGFMKDKDFTNIRKWVAENSESDTAGILHKIYKRIDEFFTPRSAPLVTWVMGDYERTLPFCVDREIFLTTVFVLIMKDGEFK